MIERRTGAAEQARATDLPLDSSETPLALLLHLFATLSYTRTLVPRVRYDRYSIICVSH